MPATPHAVAETPAAGKDPFDIDHVFRLLREATSGLPPAAMFAMRDAGYATPFEQLVAALVSARTRDETTIPVCRRLFALARTPEAMAALPEATIAAALHGATFPEPKARDIRALSARIAAAGGVVPDRMEGLMALRGVGPKIAALTLGVGFGRAAAISVDIHVHRVANRWGYVTAPTPERTMLALQGVLPRAYWVEINERLVPFGKHVCTGERPRCSTCPLLGQCRQVGVGAHQ
ncbi:MAG: endonuclease III [Acetobacteraceae bacterium]|nr:endonuclease III [Acetobacteraceae bacterium]